MPLRAASRRGPSLRSRPSGLFCRLRTDRCRVRRLHSSLRHSSGESRRSGTKSRSERRSGFFRGRVRRSGIFSDNIRWSSPASRRCRPLLRRSIAWCVRSIANRSRRCCIAVSGHVRRRDRLPVSANSSRRGFRPHFHRRPPDWPKDRFRSCRRSWRWDNCPFRACCSHRSCRRGSPLCFGARSYRKTDCRNCLPVCIWRARSGRGRPAQPLSNAPCRPRDCSAGWPGKAECVISAQGRHPA